MSPFSWPRKAFRRARSRFQDWRRRRSPRVMVLVYHRVTQVGCDPWELCVRPGHFAEHLEVLRRHVKLLTAGELAAGLADESLPRRAALITFDDGYADNLFEAKPILERCEAPAIVFLASGAIDSLREFWWDELEGVFLHNRPLPRELELRVGETVHRWTLESDSNPPLAAVGSWAARTPPQTIRQKVFLEVWRLLWPLPMDQQQRLLDELARWGGRNGRTARPTHRSLSSSEVAKLVDGGLIEIGAHTVTHPALSAHPPEFQKAEIESCAASLESKFSRRIEHFAYPYGDYSPTTPQIVANLGFRTAFTTRQKVVTPKSHPWELPRYVPRDWSGEQFEEQLQLAFR